MIVSTIRFAWPFLLAACAATAACSGPATVQAPSETPASKAGEVHWTYEGATGADRWGDLSPEFATCKTGRNQSPVDIAHAIDAQLTALELHYDGRAKEIVNNGHTIQVNLDPGSTLVADGQTFNAVQYHFHSPSENRVGGESFPLEAHIVHSSSAGELAVVGILYRDGAADAGLASVWPQMPAQAKQTVPLSVPLNQLMASSTQDGSYYNFSGSLTTPPCSEGVRWYVLQTPRTVSADQVTAFTKIVGHNARPPQPLFARHVLR